MNFISGLVSVSFRSLDFNDIIKITKDSGLSAIEWGGDIHSPAGDEKAAAKIKEATLTSGLSIAEYGSYYRVGECDAEKQAAVIASARALGCQKVRIWASVKSRAAHTDEEYTAVVEDTRRLCECAPDLIFCLECHNNTLTESYSDAIDFLRDVDRPNLKMFWQPNQYRDHEYNLSALKALLPYVLSVHVFAWEGDRKLPLASHSHLWSDYLEILKHSNEESIHLMLEFMHDNLPETLKNEAKTLKNLI